MAGSKLKIDIRRNRILELIRQDGKVVVSELSHKLGATPVTIRNDLTALEQARYIDAYLKWQYGKDEHQFYDESTHRMMYDPDSPEMTSPAFISNLDLWGEDFEDWLQWQFDNDIYEV